MGYMSIFKKYFFLCFSFFKVTYHRLCITVCRNVQQKGKKQEKKERPKPPKKLGILVYVDFLKIYIFLFFFFLRNSSWIMHYSVQKCTTKEKKTRKNRKTKTPQKIWHTSICRFLKNIYFFCFSFFKVTYHGLCITVFRNVQQKGKNKEKKERPKPAKNS